MTDEKLVHDQVKSYYSDRSANAVIERDAAFGKLALQGASAIVHAAADKQVLVL